jgi:hypothetical protein
MRKFFILMFIFLSQNVMAEIPLPNDLEFSCVDEEEQFDFQFSRKMERSGQEPVIRNSVQVIGQSAVDVNYHSGKGDIISFIYRTYIYDAGRAPGVLTYSASFFTQFTISAIPIGNSFEGFVSINQKEFFSVVCVKTK